MDTKAEIMILACAALKSPNVSMALAGSAAHHVAELFERVGPEAAGTAVRALRTLMACADDEHAPDALHDWIMVPMSKWGGR